MNLSDIGKHCIWADREITKLLLSVSEDDFTKVPEHTGRSMHDLVVHILGGYEMVLGGDYNKAIQSYDSMKKEELLNSWSNLVDKFVTETEGNPSKSFSIKMDDGSKREIEGQNYLLSFTDHSTYHRGQLVTTFKIITGKEAVTTDFYSYLTKSNPLKE